MCSREAAKVFAPNRRLYLTLKNIYELALCPSSTGRDPEPILLHIYVLLLTKEVAKNLCAMQIKVARSRHSNVIIWAGRDGKCNAKQLYICNVRFTGLIARRVLYVERERRVWAFIQKR